MKEVGVITLYGDKNYGNKFQNYAVYSIIRKMGYNPINYIDSTDIGVSKSIRIKVDIATILNGNIKEYKRKLLFRKFHRLYIKNNSIIDSKDQKDIHKLLCGSDQIWNPYFAAKETYFGSFVAIAFFLISKGFSKASFSERSKKIIVYVLNHTFGIYLIHALVNSVIFHVINLK